MADFEQVPSEALSKVTDIVEKLNAIKIEMGQADPENPQRSWREYITANKGILGGVNFFNFLKQGLEDKEPIAETMYGKIKAVFPKELIKPQLDQIQILLDSRGMIETQTIISFISEVLPDTLYAILENLEEVRDSYDNQSLIEWTGYMRDYLGNLSNGMSLHKFTFKDIPEFTFTEDKTFIYNPNDAISDMKESFIRGLKFNLMHAKDFYTIHNFDLD
jgi:hypothetical protein